VQALMKKETQDETSFTTKISLGGKTSFIIKKKNLRSSSDNDYYCHCSFH